MNKIILFLLAGFSFIISLQAQISPVLPANYGITGVRQSDADGSMILTGGTGAASLDTPSPAFLYSGFLPSSVSTTGTYTNNLTPIINGTPVTGGVQFYGPNTPYYDPWIGTGNILAVGAYKATTFIISKWCDVPWTTYWERELIELDIHNCTRFAC